MTITFERTRALVQTKDFLQRPKGYAESLRGYVAKPRRCCATIPHTQTSSLCTSLCLIYPVLRHRSAD